MRTSAGVLALALLPLFPLAAHAQQSLRGDVDGDGRVTAGDAQAVRDHVAGRPTRPGIALLPNGDANGDGRITGVDAAMIQAFAAGRDLGRFGLGRPVGGGGTGNLAMLYECTVDVVAGTQSCGSPRPAGAAADVILAKPHIGFVTTGAATSRANSANEDTTSANVAIINNLDQPIGTTDGTSAAASGNRVFFEGPRVASVTSGTLASASVRLEGTDGTGDFQSPDGSIVRNGKAYVQYDGVLAKGATSGSRLWRFVYTPNTRVFTYSVLVSAPVQYEHGWITVTPATLALAEGSTSAPLTATIHDVAGAPVAGTVTWSSSDAGIASVDAAGVVTGVAAGTATITATSGLRSGSMTVAVCPSLAVGGAYVADMPAGASLCLSGLSAGAEYTVVPVNTSAAGSVALSVTGTGIVAASGAPTPNRIPGLRASQSALEADESFEARLRRMEISELAGRQPAAPRSARAPRMAITPGVPAVGALMSLNVETDNACGTNDIRTGRVMAVGTRSIVLADTMNPSNGLSAAQYQTIADTFDIRIHPVVAGVFGEPVDIDNNGRVVIFYTRAVNELTPPGSSSFVGGFVFSRDLFAQAGCPTSNVGEMFYMLAADPSGTVNGNPRSVALVMQRTFGTLAHEYQHLINASRRMYVNTPWNNQFEQVWLNEGLSHIAEELMFYSESGLAPGGNVNGPALFNAAVQAPFFRYAEANIGRLRQWLLAPHASGAFQSDDDLATRGAAWSFLRYAADRRGIPDAAFFGGLVNTQAVGMANLQAALGTDPLPWFRDFAAAMYADDAGGTPPAAFQQPSWNFRSLYTVLDYDGVPGCVCTYPLAPRNPGNGVADSFTLTSGGAAAYLRMGVEAGQTASVTLSSAGAAPPSTVRLAVVRRK